MRIPAHTDNWRKSSYSQPSENCVEVALGAEIGVRDTKDRNGGELAVTGKAWMAFLHAISAT